MSATRSHFVDHMLEYHEKAACLYDTWAAGVNQRVGGRAAEIAAVGPDEIVVDVGCGTGTILRELGGARGRLGADLSSRLLQGARAQDGGAGYAVMDAERLALRSRSVDVVTMGQTLALLADPPGGLAEARRVLRPGGRLVVTCQRRSLQSRAQRIFFALLDDLADEHPMILPRLSADRAVFGEPRVLAELLKDAGFADVRMTQLMTGQHTATAAEWVDLMTWAGPRPHALISVLGPGKRAELAATLEQRMRDGGEVDFHFQIAVTVATAFRR